MGDSARRLEEPKIRNQWKLAYIGFFDPTADDKASTNGTITWNDVDQFTNSIRENATTAEGNIFAPIYHSV